MGRRTYRVAKSFGGSVLRSCSRPMVLHRDRADIEGGYLLAANHMSVYDVAVAIVHTPRMVEWISIVEVFENPLVAWFFNQMEAVPLDRSRPDPNNLRKVVNKLKAGRVVGIFPEGEIRKPEASVLNGGKIRSGIGRLARLAGVPIIPCVILESALFSKGASWFPWSGVVYGMSYGRPIYLDTNLPAREAASAMESQMVRDWQDLHQELLDSWPE